MQEQITEIKSVLLKRILWLAKRAKVKDLCALTTTLDSLSGAKTDPMETLLKVLEKTQSTKQKDKK